ncbi:S41 family peptidase [Photobacterium leiognathi]|uniref:S41 family peptidase n=1 Tax=Photobacterium leiognathi TaxID=553611 RepID=UPI0029821974|nr:S41 family peptidase [Photobacterium leiognathi]
MFKTYVVNSCLMILFLFIGATARINYLHNQDQSTAFNLLLQMNMTNDKVIFKVDSLSTVISVVRFTHLYSELVENHGAEMAGRTVDEALDEIINDEWTVLNPQPNTRQSNKMYKSFEFVDKDTLYIRFDLFNIHSINWVKKILTGKEYSNLVFDFRYNLGGEFQSAFDLSNLFLPKGVLISEVNLRKENLKFYATEGEKLNDKNIVFLISEKTASAPEMVIHTLRNKLDSVIVVGEKSYGKDVGYREFIGIKGSKIVTSVNMCGIEPCGYVTPDKNESWNNIDFTKNYLIDLFK